jgi:non-ribosomal peptide synthetase component F
MQTLLDAGALPVSVITVNLAGEPLHPSLVDALYARQHVRRVNDLYGPSETTTNSTWATRAPNQPATIGRPIANTQVHVLDADFMAVPIGSNGELWIGGEGVARGYWRRPELTAERFVPDPFRKGSRRLYRTGDLVRQRADGQLEYIGRADHQVKLRGFRIELGEIEAVLATHPALSASVACVQQDSSGNRRLAAFLVARNAVESLSYAVVLTWLRV